MRRPEIHAARAWRIATYCPRFQPSNYSDWQREAIALMRDFDPPLFELFKVVTANHSVAR
ncbi:hypothetical protein DW352_00600 [Pseudolabrys taiwanensis]|uniref:Uncharacterized protein n=1 Tax=Pseudolabrys taiwanensis TaxID=331696 RepID=A0A345ZQE8_9HYPH|nr:hypothetical protein DW352_00600 [Pseudolabrys taiwanensis]